MDYSSAEIFQWKIMYGVPKFIGCEIVESLWICTFFEKLSISFLDRSCTAANME